jgi:Tol biopolymer transport system component
MWSNRSAENEWSPVWSSNQHYIAYECMFFEQTDLLDLDEYSWFGKNDICIFNRDNNQITRLTTERGMSPPAWSPDGTMLAWFNGVGITLWNMSTNQFQYFNAGRQSHELDRPLEWSQDGRKIFMQGDGAVFDVKQKVFLDPLPISSDPDNCCFTWSPDGRYVAYKRVFLKDSSGYHRQVVIMQNEQTFFTSDLEIGLDDPLRWSPDSSLLAWAATIDSKTVASQHKLALTDAAGQNTRYVTFGRGIFGISTIAWSPSGNQIAVRFWDELQIVNLSSIVSSGTDVTIQKENLTLQGSSPNGLSWSPDEQYIAYETNWEPYSQIWILELGTNVQVPLVSRSDD